MIRQTFLAFSMIGASTALYASETTHLRCEAQGIVSKNLELITIDLSDHEATHTSHTGKMTFFNIVFENSETIIGYGDRWGRVSRLEVNRITGAGRIDSQMGNEEKASLLNEKTGSIGYPPEEEVWLGYDLACRPAEQLF